MLPEVVEKILKRMASVEHKLDSLGGHPPSTINSVGATNFFD
jgi:hypothetical protein